MTSRSSVPPFGNELWEYDENWLTRCRGSSINDIRIGESERHIFGLRSEADRGKDVNLAAVSGD